MRPEWQRSKLRDLADIQKGKIARTIEEGSREGLPYLGASALEGGVSQTADPRNAVLSREDDALMLWDGERSGLVGRGVGIVSSTVARIRPRMIVEGGFLLHALRRKFAWIQGRRTGTGVPHVPKDLSEILIINHPRDQSEQRRIAEILDTIDEAIRRTEQVTAKLQQMKQGLLHDLLTRGIDDRGNLRDPAQQPREFRESPIGWIPTEWDLRPLRAWVNKDAPITYGIVQAGPDVPGGVPYIRTGDMAGESLRLDGLPRTSRSIARSYARSTVRTGDIVYAIRATVGKALPVPRELDGANLTQGTARISPGPEIGKRFLLWALRGWSVMRQVASVQKGTTYQEITLGQLREILVAAPRSRAEQDRVADSIDSIDQQLGEERRLGGKLTEVKRGLLEDLLSGRVRAQSPEGVCA